MKVGKASYGGGKHQHKIKDGDNVLRILPPLGELAEKGRWSVFYSIEWGFKGTDGRNKPFQNVRKTDYKTKMVEVESEAHLQRERIKEKKMKIAKLFKDKEISKDDTKSITELSMRFNLDNKHYLNAVDTDGKIGLLKIGSRAMSALRDEIKKLTESGVDPLSVDNGRFFNFHRSGTGLDTQYQVTVYKEKKEVEIDGQKETVYRDVVHKLDDAILGRLATEAYELGNMYPTVTPEQVEEMVNAYDLDLSDKLNYKLNEVAGATKVDEVFESVGKPSGSGNSSEPKGEPKAETPKEEAPKEEKKEAGSEPEDEKQAPKEEAPKEEAKAETPEPKEEKKAEEPSNSSSEDEDGLSPEDLEFLRQMEEGA